MCREALASGERSFSDGLNYSILFMLGMVVAVPLGFGLVVWKSYRSERARVAAGQTFAPDGKERWGAE
jgi:hypothetical protein